MLTGIIPKKCGESFKESTTDYLLLSVVSWCLWSGHSMLKKDTKWQNLMRLWFLQVNDQIFSHGEAWKARYSITHGDKLSGSFVFTIWFSWFTGIIVHLFTFFIFNLEVRNKTLWTNGDEISQSSWNLEFRSKGGIKRSDFSAWLLCEHDSQEMVGPGGPTSLFNSQNPIKFLFRFTTFLK